MLASSVELQFRLDDIQILCSNGSVMHEREYNRLRREIEAEYRKKLDALEMVWGMSNASRRSGNETNRTTHARKGALLNIVRSVLPEMQGEFSQRDVLDKVREKNAELDVKRASLSSTLRRLADDKEIDLLELGAGKRPSRYKVIDAVQI